MLIKRIRLDILKSRKSVKKSLYVKVSIFGRVRISLLIIKGLNDEGVKSYTLKVVKGLLS